MGSTAAAIVIGVLYPVSLAGLVISFVRLRSDMHAGFDRLDARFDQFEARFDRHCDRLEAKLDGLNMTLAREGPSIDSEVPLGADD